MNNSLQVKAADAFVTCGDFTASVCRLRNTSAVSIDYQVDGATSALAAGELSPAIDLTSTTREVSVRRTDLSASPVSVMIEWGLTADEAFEQAKAAVSAHDRDPAAHLNIVRRTLAGDLTLTAADQPRQNIVPDADRDVLLPAESAAQWAFLLHHVGASYNLTVKRAGGSPVGVLIPGSPLAVTWDGTGFGLC